MKRKLFIAVSLLMALSMLAACGTQAPTATTAAPATTAAQTAAAATTAAQATEAAAAEAAAGAAEGSSQYDTYVTISTNITDADKQGQDDLYKWFTEKFNMDYEFIPMQFGERHDKARLWVASGDLPDLLWMDLNENLYAEWTQWVDEGHFKPYPEDMSRWPNLQNVFDMMIGPQLMTIDGRLYATIAKQDLTEYGYGVPMMFAYRADWAEAVGMRKEDDVYTWDEFWSMVEECIKQDPGGNGEGKTFGASAPQWYFPDCFGIWQLQHTTWGTEETSFAAIDGEYVWLPATEPFVQGLKIAVGLMERGVIWPDIVVDTNSSMYADMFTSGQLVTINENFGIGRIRDYRDKLVAAFPDLDRELCVQIAKVSSPIDDNDYWQKESPCYWSGHSMAARVTDEQMERYLDICDYLTSQEGAYVSKYGILDKDYSINADGTINLLWEKNELGNYVDPYPPSSRGYLGRILLGGGYSDLNNPRYLPEDIAEYQWSQDWDNDNATRRHLDYNLFYTPTPNRLRYGIFIEEVKAKAIEMMATANSDNIEQLWREWADGMLPRVQPVLDDLNDPEIMPYVSTDSYDDMLAYMSSR